MTSKILKKRKNLKINRKGGRFNKNSLEAEDLSALSEDVQVLLNMPRISNILLLLMITGQTSIWKAWPRHAQKKREEKKGDRCEK